MQRCWINWESLFFSKNYCCDNCPAPFSYIVWQKVYFHLFPLFVGTLSLLFHLLSCLFTSFCLLNLLELCVLQTGKIQLLASQAS